MCRTMQKKRVVHAATLATVAPVKAAYSRSGSRELILCFESTHGIAGLEGRETMARLTGRELAHALGSIPAKDFEDRTEDFLASGAS